MPLDCNWLAHQIIVVVLGICTGCSLCETCTSVLSSKGGGDARDSPSKILACQSREQEWERVAIDVGCGSFIGAAERDNVAKVRQLIEEGADVNCQGADGTTGLLRASAKGNRRVVELLLDHDASPGIQEQEGWTALHAAAQNGHVEIAVMLLEHGAPVNASNWEGATPLHVARDTRTVEVLIAYGADVNARTITGSVPLHQATAEIAKVLLRNGADRTLRNQSGDRPIDLARRHGDTALVDVLTNYGLGLLH